MVGLLMVGIAATIAGPELVALATATMSEASRISANHALPDLSHWLGGIASWAANLKNFATSVVAVVLPIAGRMFAKPTADGTVFDRCALKGT
jgi:hypothetical protein